MVLIFRGEPARRRLDAADAGAWGDGDAHVTRFTPLPPKRVTHQPVRGERVLFVQIMIRDHFSAVADYLEGVVVGMTISAGGIVVETALVQFEAWSVGSDGGGDRVL